MAENSTPRPILGLIQAGIMLLIVVLVIAVTAEFLPTSRSQSDATATFTATPTVTVTPSPTATSTPRPAIQIEAPTPTPTPRVTNTPTPSPTITWTPVPTDTPTATALPTNTPTLTPTSTPNPLGEPAPVLDVIDGNTIEVFLNGRRRTVRYVYIKTPLQGEALYGTALDANEALVSGQTVYLERAVSDIDSAGHLLRYVRLADGRLVNAELARLGLAFVDEGQPGVQYAGDIWVAQADAKRAGIGIWAGERFLPYAISDAALYTGPGLTYPIADTVAAGETLTLKYRDPTSTWYQLDNDLWIASPFVTNVARVPDLAPGYFRFAILASIDPNFVPFATTDAKLYTGPGFGYPVAGVVYIGQPLTIIDRDPTGAWYLLDNGLWICNLFVDTGYVDTTLSEQARFVSEVRPFIAALVQGWDTLYTLFFFPDLEAESWQLQVLDEIATLQGPYDTLLNVRPPEGMTLLYAMLEETVTLCQGWTDAINQSLDRFNEADIKYTATLMAACRDNLVVISAQMEAAVDGVVILELPTLQTISAVDVVEVIEPIDVVEAIEIVAIDTITPVPVEGPSVLIQSISSEGEVPVTESDEYVVIANVGSVAQNLSGWRLNAGDAGQDFFFPPIDLLPGQTCRIYTNEIHIETGGLSFASGQAIWNNVRDCGYLYDAAGLQVSEYCYE